MEVLAEIGYQVGVRPMVNCLLYLLATPRGVLSSGSATSQRDGVVLDRLLDRCPGRLCLREPILHTTQAVHLQWQFGRSGCLNRASGKT